MRKVISLSIDQKTYDDMQHKAQQNNQTISQYLKYLHINQENITKRSIDLVEAGQDTKIVGLCILVSRGSILITKRRMGSRDVPNLTWSFPGGELSSLKIKQEMRQIIEEHTGIHITGEITQVSSRLIPDKRSDASPILALYFVANARGRSVKLSDKYSAYWWIPPMNVFKFFSTTVSDEVTDVLKNIRN